MNIIKLIAVGFLGIIVVGTLIPELWSMFVGTDTAIQALTETDEATTMLQALWPTILLIGGVGIIFGSLFWVLRRLNIIK